MTSGKPVPTQTTLGDRSLRGIPAPVRIAAEFGRRFPSAWTRFDAARAARPAGAGPLPTWLTYREALSALRHIQAEDAANEMPIETVADLYSFGTWRVTQGIYRFDDDLLHALADTPLDISLPASLLTRLPEWAIYVETNGFRHFGKPIAGMIATLFDAPSGLSLILTLIPESASLDDADRLQFHLTDMPLRDRLLKDVGERGFRREEFRETLAEIETLELPEEKASELKAILSDAKHEVSETALNLVLVEIVPFISLLLYLCSEEPDMPNRTLPPTGKSTKRGIRFFPPPQPRVWPVGVRIGAALRQARAAHDDAGAHGRSSVRPHIRKAHWHKFWTGPRDGERRLRIRWLMPMTVNVRPDDVLPAVIHPVFE